MRCKNCNTELPAQAKFCSQCGARVPAEASIQVDQEIGTVKGNVAGAVLGDGALPAGLNLAASQKVDNVESGGAVVGAVVGDHAQVGGQRQYGDVVQGDKRVTHTSGGAHIEGGVNVSGGGDFVGRDKIDHSIKTGNITGSTGVAIGHGAQANVSQPGGASVGEIARAFAIIYRQIQAREEDPNVDKDELTHTVERIEEETLKGEQANPTKMERWLKTLAGMASDIGDVVIATLANPAVGIATVIRKVAEKATTQAQ